MSQLPKLPTSRRGGLTLERALLRGPRGTTALRQRLSGCAERVIITHDACLTAIVEVISGRLSFVVAGRTPRPPDRFVMVVPPRSLVRLRFERAVVGTDGLGAFGRLTGAPRVCGAKAGIALELDTLLAGEPLFEMPSDAAVDTCSAHDPGTCNHVPWLRCSATTLSSAGHAIHSARRGTGGRGALAGGRRAVGQRGYRGADRLCHFFWPIAAQH